MQPCVCELYRNRANVVILLDPSISFLSNLFAMPYCTVCGEYFEGRGTYCAYHSGSVPEASRHGNYYYSSDSSGPAKIRFSTRQRHYHSPHYADPRFLDGYHNHSTSLVKHSHRNRTTKDYTALTRPLVHAFEDLSHNHEIASLTYSVDRAGGQSLRASANFDREQCLVCHRWFPDHQKLEVHRWEFPVGCEEHGVCLREEDVQWHATDEKHERCFVRRCETEYRKEGGWKPGYIKAHMLRYHV